MKNDISNMLGICNVDNAQALNHLYRCNAPFQATPQYACAGGCKGPIAHCEVVPCTTSTTLSSNVRPPPESTSVPSSGIIVGTVSEFLVLVGKLITYSITQIKGLPFFAFANKFLACTAYSKSLFL
jgi:hypothetical protein